MNNPSSKHARFCAWFVVVAILVTAAASLIAVSAQQDRQEVQALAELEQQLEEVLPEQVRQDALVRTEERLQTQVIPVEPRSVSTTTEPVVVPPGTTIPPTTVAPHPAELATPTSITTTTTLPRPSDDYLAAEALIGSVVIEKIGMDNGVLMRGDPLTESEGPVGGELANYSRANLIGTGGTAAIGGHRTSKTAPFNQIDQLGLGDKVVVVASWGATYVYQVTASDVVYKHDFGKFLHGVNDSRSSEALVLYSCGDAAGNPGSTSHRVMVTTQLVDSFVSG